VSGVKNNGIPGRVENGVDCHRQFDNTEIRSEVTTGLGNLGNQEAANFLSEVRQLSWRQRIQIAWP